jgi:CRP-like cAMP-binding protein
MDEKFWYLKNCDLFERLSREEIKRLEERSQSREYPKASLVYLPADTSNSVMLLVKGRVKIYNLTGEGKQAVLALIEPGEVFGELALIERPSRRDEFAEAMAKSTVVNIPREEMQKLIDKHPTVQTEVTNLMGLRRQRFQRRLASLLFRSKRDGLILLLLELVETYGVSTVHGVRLDIKLSHQELASMIGSTRESVTVVLGDLQTEGLLAIRKRQIFLSDLERLAEMASGDVPQLPKPKEVKSEIPGQSPATPLV